ncbi:MAG: hypothetical protein IJF49_00985 [Clostridia bacterium]|nr:hypothetical protein [Clostridia bacterium]
MKKLFALLLAMLMCLGCLAACGEDTVDENAPALADAVTYLNSLYKDAAESTPVDYDVVGKIMINSVEFGVTWTVDNEAIAIKESTTAGFYTVDVPDKNDAEMPYVLTATVTDAAGNSESKSFNRSVPVVDTSSIVSNPEADTAYKFYMVQANVGQTLYATHELQDNKYIKSTADAKAAPDFFAEAAEGGFKFYTLIDDAKNYVTGSTVKAEDGKVSKYLNYSAEGTVWTYVADVNAWTTVIDGTEYVVGTYSSYNTFCISESSYITAENTGKTQFPAGLIAKADAESAAPAEGPEVYTNAADIVNAAYALAEDAVLSAGEKYTLTGVITAVNSAYSEQYGNVTVTITVADMADKPIECFRLKGEGADKIQVGDNITVTGIIKNYKGKVEFDAGCTLDAYKTAETIVTEAYALEAGNSLAEKYTLTGVITTVNTPYSEQYGNVTVTIQVGDMADKLIECFRLKGEGADTIKEGDTITVYGELTNYNGKIEFNSGCVLVPAAQTEA